MDYREDRRIGYRIGEYISGRLDEEGFEELKQWLDLSDENKATFRRMTSYDYLRESTERYAKSGDEADALWNKLAHRTVRRSKVFRRKLMGYAAALTVLLACAVGIMYFSGNDGEGTVMPVASIGKYAEQPVLILPDGTNIEIGEDHTTYVAELSRHTNLDIYSEDIIDDRTEAMLYHTLVTSPVFDDEIETTAATVVVNSEVDPSILNKYSWPIAGGNVIYVDSLSYDYYSGTFNYVYVNSLGKTVCWGNGVTPIHRNAVYSDGYYRSRDISWSHPIQYQFVFKYSPTLQTSLQFNHNREVLWKRGRTILPSALFERIFAYYQMDWPEYEHEYYGNAVIEQKLALIKFLKYEFGEMDARQLQRYCSPAYHYHLIELMLDYLDGRGNFELLKVAVIGMIGQDIGTSIYPEARTLTEADFDEESFQTPFLDYCESRIR